MKELPAIARFMRLPEEQLRYPVELLNQGYEPNYLATYRPDELGGIDVQTLAKLKRAVEYEKLLGEHKIKLQQSLERDKLWNETVSQVIEECTTTSQADAIIRHLRSKKGSRSIIEATPIVEAIGKAILMVEGEPPPDVLAWVASTAEVPIEQAPELLELAKLWLQHLMAEDARLLLNLQRQILRNANVTISVLPEPSKSTDSEAQVATTPATNDIVESGSMAESGNAVVALQPSGNESSDSSGVTGSVEVAETTVFPDVSTNEADVSSSSGTTAMEESQIESTQIESTQIAPAEIESASTSNDASNLSAASTVASSTVASSTVASSDAAPLFANFNQGRKPARAIRTKSLSDKQLSPRQRRRRWLRGILESYAKLRKPLRNLTPYQVLMLSRGVRSQIVAINFQQDLRPLIQACRETLCPGRHPMHHLLVEIAETGLKQLVLPKLHQDVMNILEEDSNQELIEAAVVHLQSSLLQRPVRDHRILMIDSVGQKTAAVAVVDQDGAVLHVGEIPCNSSKPDVVSQNVAALGQWVHEHQVTLIALSNGIARRYLIHSVAELMKQSADGSLYWTMVDRAGADSFCMSRPSLVELPKISRRHRAAVWLAWRLQDPLRQILKIDPARMRLGSYQRELPQKELESALQESISAAITKAGVDVFQADQVVLERIPGMTPEAAAAIVRDRQADTITDRESLMRTLREFLSENQTRQAIGFLRVYGGDQSLDGTIIHPDDYRLAERLIAHAELPMPPAAPDTWSKPDYAKIAAAHAAVAHIAIDSTQDDVGIEAHEVIVGEAPASFGNAILEDSTESTVATDAVEQVDATELETSNPEAEAPEAGDSSIDENLESTEIESSGSDTVVESEASASSSDSDLETSALRSGVRMPEIPTLPMPRPVLSIDAEKLARSWQVGRAKLKSVANCLQYPFADIRECQFPVPLRSQVPRLDLLPAGSMLSALVIGVADFGVFVELGPDCSGLIHISRLAAEFVEDPHQFVQVGDIIPVWVISVDEKRKRVALTAIAPGSADRRSENRDGNRQTSGTGDDRSGQRTQRQDRGTSQGNRGGGQHSDSRGAGSGDRRPAGSANDNNRNTSRGTSNDQRGGQRSGKFDRRNSDSRSRGDRDRHDGESNRRPVKIEPAKPAKPITEAMQQGKEPLRSFSDLMQFMKQSKQPTDANEAPQQETALPIPAPAAEISAEPSTESNQQDSDANSSA